MQIPTVEFFDLTALAIVMAQSIEQYEMLV